MAKTICTMNSFMALVLIWMIIACAEADKPLGETGTTGFQICKNASKLPVLEVLPGGGWDNSRNVDMGRVMDLTYTNCKTTEDGQYIIPDEVYTIPQKESNSEMNSEVSESWMNYQSTTSLSINTELALFSRVNGKFSTEFQRMKTLQVKDQAVTTRVQVRNRIYTVKTTPTSELSLGFTKALMDICDQLEKNQTKMATYSAELLILNYGTHVITSVDAGAASVQEDHVRSSFLSDNQNSQNTVTASAGIAFLNIVNFKVETDYISQTSLTKDYSSNRTNSRVQSFGGVPFYPGITLETWQKGITNHLVAIDRAGLPSHFFIKPDKLPGLPGPLVKKSSKTVETAVRHYYTFNTHPGCTNVDSPNFNFQANMDDDSCDAKVTNFTFGGVYQECTESSGDVLCQNSEQKNSLTGDFSCPPGYSPVHSLSQTHEEGYSRSECKKKCTLKIFCKTVCEDVFRVAKAEFRAYWCVAAGQVPDNSGLLFGGVFTDKTINPMTNAQSCPAGYIPSNSFESLKVCVSSDYELGFKFSVPFGGFFSCIMGNPLVNSDTAKDVRAPSSKKCPGGFSQHLAVISDGCQVSYCVKAGIFTGGSSLPVRLPPYTKPPLMSQVATNTVIVTNSETARSWIKDPQTNQWKSGEPSELRRAMTVIHGDSNGMSGGEAAGITLGVTIALGIVITLAIYGTRKYKKKEYQEIEEQESLVGSLATDATVLNGEEDPSPA